MSSNNKQNRIEELNILNLSDTVIDNSGWERKTIPEATSKNMFIFMNKINELIEVVNELENKNREKIKQNLHLISMKY